MALTYETSNSEANPAATSAAVTDSKAKLSRKGKLSTKMPAEVADASRRAATAGNRVNPGKKAVQSPNTKASIVLKKLNSPKGATIEMLMQATGWQTHSVRGFLSAEVRKKLGLNLVSETGKDGIRRYRIDDAARISK